MARSLRPRTLRPRTLRHGASATELDDHSFFEALEGHSTIVEFWAPWCAPCTAFRPDFERAASERSGRGVQFARVNVDVAGVVATAFEVLSIPTLIVIDRFGHEIDREVGVPSRRRLGQLIRLTETMAAAAGERSLT